MQTTSARRLNFSVWRAAVLALAVATAACTSAPVTNSSPVASPDTSSATPPPSGFTSDHGKPEPMDLLGGYGALWHPTEPAKLQGIVHDPRQLSWNDRLASWINQHSTPTQQFRALQDSQLRASDGAEYDQSITMADALGQRLGSLYVRGRLSGKLPLTSRLLNTTDGLVGDYLTSGSAKDAYGYPRPYLRSSSATPVHGDSQSCAPDKVNAQSLAQLRKGKPWGDANGNLLITRVPAATDTTRSFTSKDVRLDPYYRGESMCRNGAFPSGHARAAYAVGITLATLVPELAPSILARTSEAANNRIVLGVHYPLDVIGGRITGEAAASTRWSDERFRNDVLSPARVELVNYLETSCGARLATCIKDDKPYANDPYSGAIVPGGTDQATTGQPTKALAVYTERLSYGFSATRPRGLAASVPSGAENLLLTTFPSLTSDQRRDVLAQTEIDSGNALDTTPPTPKAVGPGSWQRLNLAAAMSATVEVRADGTVKVLAVGGSPTTVHRK
ncbi:phosphatase PAP2 family protein [Micropruina sp.]|uniref:phosphatase PAP2 family protein n=1 Tax=Micropruina sp. TaxID=2737536 RepID=UPI0039E62140